MVLKCLNLIQSFGSFDVLCVGVGVQILLRSQLLTRTKDIFDSLERHVENAWLLGNQQITERTDASLVHEVGNLFQASTRSGV